MLGLSELRQTKVYQEALAEGEQVGVLRGERALVLRQLQRKVGVLPVDLDAQIQALELSQLEALAEALLDFSQLSDLSSWLQKDA